VLGDPGLTVPPSNDRRGQWWWYTSKSADETARPQGAGDKRRRPKRRIFANLAEALKRLACNMHETLGANLNTLYMRLERETAPSLHPAAWHHLQKWAPYCRAAAVVPAVEVWTGPHHAQPAQMGKEQKHGLPPVRRPR
jgi:hypothetical protein